MWREEDLEEQVKSLEKQLREAEVSTNRLSQTAREEPSPRTDKPSKASHAVASAQSCILCGAPHELEDCPMYTGNTSLDDADDDSTGSQPNGHSPSSANKSTAAPALAGSGKSGLANEQVFCENCSVSFDCLVRHVLFHLILT